MDFNALSFPVLALWFLAQRTPVIAQDTSATCLSDAPQFVSFYEFLDSAAR